MLMIPLCYGPLFWGMIHVDSGTAAVLELSLTPVALLGFALLLRDELFDVRRLAAIMLGVVGLGILFGPEVLASWMRADDGNTALRVAGMAAIAAAAIIYAAGSVLARPLLRRYPAGLLAGSTTLIGGAALVVASLVAEPGGAASLDGDWGWRAWAGWLFLVLFGSLVGYTLYMRLLRDIGASRAGAYAFVSPVVAVLLGILTYGENVSFIELAGMLVMLAAAYFALLERDEKPGGRPVIGARQERTR
jgi:drug/metabolite transporter (DMT)-like permease